MFVFKYIYRFISFSSFDSICNLDTIIVKGKSKQQCGKEAETSVWRYWNWWVIKMK